MINLYPGANDVYLTLKERCAIESPNYLFRFIHRTTNAEITFVKKGTTDLSEFKDRYNLFSISGDDFDPGMYSYQVYEQESASNTDYENASLVESGIMLVHSEERDYNIYQTENNYVTR
jgi:hypothetical protein